VSRSRSEGNHGTNVGVLTCRGISSLDLYKIHNLHGICQLTLGYFHQLEVFRVPFCFAWHAGDSFGEKENLRIQLCRTPVRSVKNRLEVTRQSGTECDEPYRSTNGGVLWILRAASIARRPGRCPHGRTPITSITTLLNSSAPGFTVPELLPRS
jgi:hypothetical protein